MPELPDPKHRTPSEPPALVQAELPYAELEVATNFSFLRGASHPDELVFRAAELGYKAIAVTDRNTLSGVVRAHEAARKVKLKLIIGARLTLLDAPDVLLWCADRPAYARLCRLLTTGKRRADKGACALWLEDVATALAEVPGLLAAICPPEPADSRSASALARLCEAAGHSTADPASDRLSIATSCLYSGTDSSRLRDLLNLSRSLGVPLLATNGVYYHDPSRRPLQDILTCVRHGCTIQEAGYRLFPNGERYLKSPAQMHHVFHAYPAALRRGLQIVDRCTFSLDELKYDYPDELVPPGMTATQYLRQLAEEGSHVRYPAGVPEKVSKQIEHELKLIAQLRYEHYFLTVYDLVKFARSRGILCQGRGSAANSTVCYCIGVTAVDPNEINLLFERFVSAARKEPPDIDVDFEHERREEVLQYLYAKYGRERAGMTAEIITYRGRSAVRDVGKALGLSLDLVDQMAKRLEGWTAGAPKEEQLRELGLDPADRTIQQVVNTTAQLLGFPRHLSQHVGGMIMTRSPLCEIVPVENASMPGRTVIEWDKDDIDVVGLLKVDILALGMLTCISKAFQFIENWESNRRSTGVTPVPGTVDHELVPTTTKAAHSLHGRDARVTPEAFTIRGLAAGPSDSQESPSHCSSRLELHIIRPNDPTVYDMICRADTVGVFQIESRAQMSMLPRLKPRCFYDLVIEVAIVRPGPIQGNMVHPYLRRRCGLEPVTFPSEALREVLEKTLGVPLFQEQAMRLAMVAAGFTADEADQLRKAMAAWKRSTRLLEFRDKIIDGMLARGYERAFAEQCFEQIKGFGDYGFPESHAASFAHLVYVSAWLKCHHPAAFAAALVNSQPMGFYAPAQIIRDAQDHGVAVRAIDVNWSEWDCLLERRDQETKRRRDEVEDTDDVVSTSHSVSSSLGLFVSNSSHPALRLGFRLIKGLRCVHADQLVAERKTRGPFKSIRDVWLRTRLTKPVLKRLAEADAFGSIGLSRREALWQVLGLEEEVAPLFEINEEATGRDCQLPIANCQLGNRDRQSEIGDLKFQTIPQSTIRNPQSFISNRQWAIGNLQSSLPPMPLGQEVMTDYATAGLSLKAHPVGLVREELDARKIITAAAVRQTQSGRWVRVAGLVLIRQRPGTASGIVFETLEDETGIVNLIVRPDVYDRYKQAAKHGTLVEAQGIVERQSDVTHVMVKKMEDLTYLVEGLRNRSRDFR